jgi:repressor LexA
MRLELTEKQKELYDTIKDFIDEHTYSPTVRELMEILGKKSPGTIHPGLKILKEKGYIDYQYNRNRTIRIIGGNNERVK